jgi:hypothetical protein
MHPIRKSNNLSSRNLFPPFRSELLPHFFRKYFNNSMSRDSIILIQNHLFLILVGRYNFQIVGSEFLFIDLLDTIDKFYGGSVTVLGEEGYRSLASFDSFEDTTDRSIYKESILYFILWFLCRFSE